MLEAQGFRVIIARAGLEQQSTTLCSGEPNSVLRRHRRQIWDSMINRYTADRKLRHDDAYTPDNVAANAWTAPRWSTPSAAR